MDSKKIFHFSSTSWIDMYWLKKIQAQKKSHKKRYLFFMAFSLSFLFVFVYSIRYMENQVKSMKEFEIHKQSLEIKELPEWLLPFTQKIVPLPLPDIKNIFEPNLCTQVAEAYQRNPWVKKSQEVIKKYPNRVYARLILRKPFAFVKEKESYFLIDEEGVFLPGIYTTVADFSLPIIEGIKEGIHEPGFPCQDSILSRVLEVLSFFSKKKISEKIPIQILRIESLPETSSQILVFLTKKNIRVLWGNISEPAYVTLEEQEKNLPKLIHFLSDEKNLQENMEIDLRFGYTILRKKKP